jgi:hypothetical protein
MHNELFGALISFFLRLRPRNSETTSSSLFRFSYFVTYGATAYLVVGRALSLDGEPCAKFEPVKSLATGCPRVDNLITFFSLPVGL